MKRVVIGLFFILSVAACRLFGQTNLTLLGSLNYNNYLSDVWGYTKDNGDELALVTTVNGFSVVDVSNPEVPNEIFYKASAKPDTWWRDVKTWDKYAYVVSEATDGLYIVDLEQIPGTIQETFFFGDNYPFTKAHNIFIDENGIAYIFGANYGNGGVIMLDVASDPLNPVELGVFDLYYVHDGYVRGDTLWASCINNGLQAVVNVLDKATPQIVATWNTMGNYSHNCWPSDDGKTLYTTDEIPGGYITSYNVSDLNNVIELDKVKSNYGNRTVPHNVHFLNNFLITSYYNDGILIHDVTKKDLMVEIGHYDTEPNYSGDAGGNSNDYYWGAWGVYPFLPSGNILVSDVKNGLVILEPTYQRAAFLSGIVQDSCGNKLENVKIEILNENTEEWTNSSGEFKLGSALSGVFDIRLTKQNYDTLLIKGVNLVSGQEVLLEAIIGATGLDYLSSEIVLNTSACVYDINASADGGVGDFIYLWNNNESTQTIQTQDAGIYIVTITDALNCSSSDSVIIEDDFPLLSASLEVSLLTCKGNDGKLEAIIDGGQGNYTQLWSNGSSANSIGNLAAGNYTVTISDDNNCSVILEQIIAPYEEIMYNYTVSDVSVKNGSDGMIGVNINGGNGNLGILWNNGEDSIVIENLSAGVYAFTVTDESDCEKISEDIHVNEANLNSVLITPEKSCFVYPNPSSGFISISCDEIKKYTLFDDLGRCLVDAYYYGELIDIRNLDAGIYWLCLKGSDDEFLEVLPIYLNY